METPADREQAKAQANPEKPVVQSSKSFSAEDIANLLQLGINSAADMLGAHLVNDYRAAISWLREISQSPEVPQPSEVPQPPKEGE